MRICLVGGIFNKSAAYRRKVSATPETILLKGLRQRGCVVESRGHYGPFDFNDFDVVHVHHLSYGALIAAGEHKRTAFVFTPHQDRTRSLLRDIAMRYVIRHAEAVVALSDTELTWQREKWSVRPERQVVIPNGIDAATFSFVPPARPSDGLWRLLYIGQLSHRKGVYDLLDALALLAEDRNIRFELEIVYHIASEENRLRAYAKSLELTNVRFLGVKTPGELSRIYSECHFLVVPSHREALPSVISEALLVGRPVIATEVAAIREQLAGFGVLTRPGAPLDLARAIRFMVMNYHLYVSRAAAASGSARERFSINRMLDRHITLYERVGAQGGCNRPRLAGLVVGGVSRLLARRSREVRSNK
jgi:glycosyltransferase involved in cell wall biosynthesis